MDTKEFAVSDMINILLDVLVQHGNLEIYCEMPLSLEVKEDEEEEYLAFALNN